MNEYFADTKDIAEVNKQINELQSNAWIFRYMNRSMIRFLSALDDFMHNESLKEKAFALKDIEKKNWLEMYKEHVNDNVLYCNHCHEFYPRTHWHFSFEKEDFWEKCIYGNFYAKVKYLCQYAECPKCKNKKLLEKTYISKSKDYPLWALQSMKKEAVDAIESEKE